MDWTSELIDRTTALWKEGNSATAIAVRLNTEFSLSVTRNAVIGKLHRLGHTRGGIKAPYVRNSGVCRSDKPRAPRAPKPVAVRSSPSLSHRPIPVMRVTVPAPIPLEGTFSILDVGENKCKYPIGSSEYLLHSFCCHPSEGVYCEYHRRLATSGDKAGALRAMSSAAFFGGYKKRAA